MIESNVLGRRHRDVALDMITRGVRRHVGLRLTQQYDLHPRSTHLSESTDLGRHCGPGSRSPGVHLDATVMTG